MIFGIRFESFVTVEKDIGLSIFTSLTFRIKVIWSLRYGEFKKLLAYLFSIPFSKTYLTLCKDPKSPMPSLEEYLTNSIIFPDCFSSFDSEKDFFFIPNSFRVDLSTIWIRSSFIISVAIMSSLSSSVFELTWKN